MRYEWRGDACLKVFSDRHHLGEGVVRYIRVKLEYDDGTFLYQALIKHR